MNTFLIFAQEHWILSAAFVLLLIAIVIYESIFGQKANANSISPQEAIHLINRKDAVVVDVRRRDAFVRGHIINSAHLPIADLDKDIKKLHAHKHKPIIVVCAQGTDSAKAASVISKYEFLDVKILKGGLTAWRNDKLPLEKA